MATKDAQQSRMMRFVPQHIAATFTGKIEQTASLDTFILRGLCAFPVYSVSCCFVP